MCFIVLILNQKRIKMLKIRELHKSYKDKHVLKGVNLHVNQGEVKGLIGVNGAGKSTLIECVCGVKKFDAGEILINDINITDMICCLWTM